MDGAAPPSAHDAKANTSHITAEQLIAFGKKEFGLALEQGDDCYTCSLQSHYRAPMMTLAEMIQTHSFPTVERLTSGEHRTAYIENPKHYNPTFYIRTEALIALLTNQDGCLDALRAGHASMLKNAEAITKKRVRAEAEEFVKRTTPETSISAAKWEAHLYSINGFAPEQPL